jgi:hypothetical protein
MNSTKLTPLYLRDCVVTSASLITASFSRKLFFGLRLSFTVRSTLVRALEFAFGSHREFVS